MRAELFPLMAVACVCALAVSTQTQAGDDVLDVLLLNAELMRVGGASVMEKRFLDRAVEIHPSNGRAWTALADWHERSGRTDDAAYAVRKAAEVSTGDTTESVRARDRYARLQTSEVCGDGARDTGREFIHFHVPQDSSDMPSIDSAVDMHWSTPIAVASFGGRLGTQLITLNSHVSQAVANKEPSRAGCHFLHPCMGVRCGATDPSHPASADRAMLRYALDGAIEEYLSATMSAFVGGTRSSGPQGSPPPPSHGIGLRFRIFQSRLRVDGFMTSMPQRVSPGGRAKVSGLYAVDVPVDCRGGENVLFADPRPQAAHTTIRGWYGADVPVAVDLVPGTAVIFPAFLRRYIPRNGSQSPRMIVLFDAEVERCMREDAEADANAGGGANGVDTGDGWKCVWFDASRRHRKDVQVAVRQLWPTPVMVHEDPAMREHIGHLSSLLLDLEQTEPTKRKSNKGGWQSAVDLFERESFSPAHARARDALRNSTYAAVRQFVIASASHVHLRREGIASRRGICNSIVDERARAPESVGSDALLRMFHDADCHPPPLSLTVEVVHAWGCINRHSHSNAPHVHPEAHVSGVFYVSTGGDAQSAVFHEDPRPGAAALSLNEAAEDASGPPLHKDACDSAYACDAPYRDDGLPLRIGSTAGMFILFPGFLEHHVSAHRTDDARIAVSFNARVSFGDADCRGDGHCWTLSIPRRHAGTGH